MGDIKMVLGVSLTRNDEFDDMLKLLKGERRFIESKVVKNAPCGCFKGREPL